MASNVLTEGILTIAVVIAASAVVAVFVQGSNQLNMVQSMVLQDAKETASTSITIVFAAQSSEREVKVWVKNTGRAQIDAAQIQRFDIFFGKVPSPALILYNGTYDRWDFEIVNDLDRDGRLDQGETLEITVAVSWSIGTGDYVVRVNTHNGVGDTYYFSL
ncbi:MAG: hypothetical protein QFX35_06170 [Candidatus Verstraetearchaeota archaeon]|nr:hypothetical protein [Candidatus Verstraetearchaeota archaeon]